jgi:hypothetical protein
MLHHGHVSRARATLLLAALAALAACAPVQPGSSYVSPADYRRASVLLSDEIDRSPSGTAYDAAERLRPAFLQSTRGSSAQLERRVYVDGMWVGGLSALRTISPLTIREIRYLSAIEATARFGAGNGAGAVLVTTGGTPEP